MTHYHALLVGYGTALAGWLVMARVFPTLWPKQDPVVFPHPWREVRWALLATVGVIAIGLLYQHGWLLPQSGVLEPLIGAGNQIFIFSPFFLLLILRKHSLSTAWLPTRHVWARLLVGVSLALLAILTFTVARTGSRSWLEVVPDVYQPENLFYFVQILLQDITIAILFVRFRAALSLKTTIVLVAVLFAAAHIPAFLDRGDTLNELASLLLDAGLGIAVLAVVERSSDIWWFWCVHFAMDMMQFHAMA